MITVSTEASSDPQANDYRVLHHIIAQPNQSASWENNKRLILSVGLFSGLVATLFGLLGAWLILPFAGIEVSALGSVLYIVCRRCNRRHILHFSKYQLTIEKGIRQRQQCWQFDKVSTSIHVERSYHPSEPLKISLYGQSVNGQFQQVIIGDFLNKADSVILLTALREQGLIVRSDSPYLLLPL